MNNFSFMADEFPALEKLGTLAEGYLFKTLDYAKNKISIKCN